MNHDDLLNDLEWQMIPNDFRGLPSTRPANPGVTTVELADTYEAFDLYGMGDE